MQSGKTALCLCVRSPTSSLAHTGLPATTGDAVYTYLACIVAEGEHVTQVFPPGEFVILPAWTTTAALTAIYSRVRRQ